jgi:putative folate metabolism gamma-glutamate ligase
MRITPIKTRVLVPPRDDLLAAIKDAVPRLEENSILAVTSKVVGIWQGRCVPKSDYPDKDELIKKEADKYLPRDFAPNRWVMHTIKNNLFIPSAGIDESNANNYYVLWPRDPKQTAKELYDWARAQYRIRNLGVIITDSHTIPLRRGTLGISLAHYGLLPLKDYRGERDIFGREFVIQVADIADGLAAAAVVSMGEGRETTPLAVITDVPFVEFTDKPYTPDKPFSSFEIEEKEDLYYPLLSSVPWENGGYNIY